MSQYSYCTTNLLTGALQAGSLPVTGQSFGRTVSLAGQFSGSLALTTTADTSLLQTWIAAVEPWKSVLWCLQDQQPVWGGPITGQPHQSITDGTLPLTASTMEAIFQCRQISETLVFANTDVFEIFRGLARYATGKSPNAQVAGLILGDSLCGIVDSITFDGSQYQKVYDAWTTLVAEYGMEYSFRPSLQPDGSLAMYLDLGYPQIGRPLDASGLQITFPGNQVFDYAYPRVASGGPANDVVATAQASTRTLTSQPPHGLLTAELDEGYPLLEDSISLTAVGAVSQAVVNGTADAQAQLESIGAMATPVIKLGAEGYPKVSQVQLGDSLEFAATSPRHPAGPGGVPGLQISARISSWQLFPPGGGQQEATWLTLGSVRDVS